MNRRIYKLLLFCMVSMLSVFVHAADELQVKPITKDLGYLSHQKPLFIPSKN